MPGVIDCETLYVDNLPTIWSPIQWELNEEERIKELEEQATASLLWSADGPETILRLLLNETEIERAYSPPEGFNPDQQGEWDDHFVTFKFKHPMELKTVRRESEHIYIEYDFGEMGYWTLDIEPYRVTIQKL